MTAVGDFVMPSLGADMESGTIVEWRVRPGDEVHRGDIVAVVDTDKSTIEVEAFQDGVVTELLVEPGVEVPIGTSLARLAPLDAPPPVPVRAAAEPAPRTVTATAGVARAAPRARRLAAEHGIDLTAIEGSGPGGAVLVSDLQIGDDKQAAMRRAIAGLMARSKREIPHYYLASTVDLGAALAWLAGRNQARPPAARVLPAALVLKATALAAREVPAVNGFWEDGGFRPADGVHVGVAVSLRGGGLVAPAIHDVDRLEVDDLMGALRDLVGRARAGRLRGSEMTDPTITVTNLGDQGVEEVLGVIYPPQVALVGAGKIVERPWAVGGMLAVRPVVRLTLAADHRASDGHDGARFLAAIERLLQTPEDL